MKIFILTIYRALRYQFDIVDISRYTLCACPFSIIQMQQNMISTVEFHILYPLSLHLWLYSVLNGLGELSTSDKKANNGFFLGPETSNLNFQDRLWKEHLTSKCACGTDLNFTQIPVKFRFARCKINYILLARKYFRGQNNNIHAFSGFPWIENPD